MWDQGLCELFVRGGPVMWPLLACSIFGAALILERSVVLLLVTGRFNSTINWLQQMISDGKSDQALATLNQSRLAVAKVAAAYLQQRNAPEALRDQVVGRVASQQIAFMERRLSWLAVLGHVTPLLGLLGTVLGLMVAFHQLDLKGAQAQTTDLAVGIWQKLLNTAFGMVIAIPCLIAYYWFDNRVGLVTQQLEWTVAYLNEWFSPASAKERP
jgi:biopolymer transport protein ExbB